MNETKRLTGYSYKLMGLGNIPGLPAQEQANQFGLDVPFGPDDLEIDENQMSCVIPFADGNRVDGSGDVIEVAGIKTERHRANPIVLFDHGKQVTLPVALSEDPITKLYTVEIDPIAKKAKGRAFFYQGKWGGKNFNGATEYDHALFCEQLFDLLAKRYIRAGSIGYQVMKGMPMQGTYGMGIPQGVHLQEVNMLEYSAVVLPCNQDTVGKALSLRRVCGKPLSSHLVKSLSPYAPPRKVQMGYEGKKALTPEQRQEMIDGSRLNSDEENIQAAEILRQIAGSPVRGDHPVDAVDEIVKPLEEESDKQADRKQHTKSLSALLKSLRAKYEQKNFDKARLEGNMGDLPTTQGESMFSIGSNVNLKAMTPRQIADLRGVIGDMSPQMLRMLQAEQSGKLVGIDDDDSNPTTADILPSVVEEQEKYGSDQKGFSQEWRTSRKGYSSDDLDAWEDEELQEEDELIMDNGGSRILPAATGYQNQQLPITDPDQTKKEEDWEDVNRVIDVRDQWESDNWGNDVGYPPDDSEEDPGIDYKILPEALTFLKYLASEDSSLDESGRMKCYHYAKSLEQYGRKGDFSQTFDFSVPPLPTPPLRTEKHPFTGHYSPKATHVNYDSLDRLHADQVRDDYDAEYTDLIRSSENPKQAGPDMVAAATQMRGRPTNYSDDFPEAGYDFRDTPHDPYVNRDRRVDLVETNPEWAKILSEIPEKVFREGFDQVLDARNQMMLQSAEDPAMPKEDSAEDREFANQTTRKSLERPIKMAIPENYEELGHVGRRVVSLRNDPAWRTHMREDPNALTEVDAGGYLVPRNSHTSRDLAYMQYLGMPPNFIGAAPISRLKYRDEVFPPEQEQEQ